MSDYLVNLVRRGVGLTTTPAVTPRPRPQFEPGLDAGLEIEPPVDEGPRERAVRSAPAPAVPATPPGNPEPATTPAPRPPSPAQAVEAAVAPANRGLPAAQSVVTPPPVSDHRDVLGETPADASHEDDHMAARAHDGLEETPPHTRPTTDAPEQPAAETISAGPGTAQTWRPRQETGSPDARPAAEPLLRGVAQTGEPIDASTNGSVPLTTVPSTAAVRGSVRERPARASLPEAWLTPLALAAPADLNVSPLTVGGPLSHSPEPPVVEVRIGTVEIRATSPPLPAVRPPPASEGFDAYRRARTYADRDAD